LNGFAANTVYRWAGYTDPGVSIDDNYYSEASLQANVVITSNFDPNWVGLYSICYQVTDPSNNKSATTCRSIRVIESITSVEEVENTKYSVYPNPSQGAFTLSFGASLTEQAKVQVFDMAGKLVYETNVNPGNTDLKMQIDLARGMYQVVVSSDGYRQVLPIQIAR